MTSEHPRVFISRSAALTVAVAVGLTTAGAAAQVIAGSGLEAAELVADLPWTFEVTVEPATAVDEAPVRMMRYLFQSTTPNTRTATGDVYLRAELTASDYGSARSAEAAFVDLLAGADPDTGLSYSWDQLLLVGHMLYRLHAECTFSEENFRPMAERLEGALRRRTSPALRLVTCRCGSGCREAAATPPRPKSRMMSPMGRTILCESAGWVLFSDGPRLVFANRGTAYRRVLVFVLALLTLIAGVNGIVWLVAGIRSGDTSRLGIVLAVVAGLTAFGASRLWEADKRDHKVIPVEDTWIAVLNLGAKTLEDPEGKSLAPLSSVRFAPVMQLGSSSRALEASWPGGSMVVYRGSPFAGSFHAALDALRRHGVDTN